MQTKHLFLTAILLVFSVLVVAGPVDPMRALEVAEQFAPQQAKGKGIKSKTAPEQSYEIVYTHRMPNSDCAAFYVVKLGEKGFVIISADDVANPILGYSYTNSWPTSISAEGDTILPPQVLSYLNDMALQIETAIEKYPNLESSDEWNNVGQKAVRKTSARKSADALPDSVGPLLTTTWGQGQYYNALCPEDANGEDGHVPTGCVATAMAQIINYWGQKEEIKTRGIHSYDSQYGNLTVNYDSTSYDFANMPDALTAESTPEQINAVAKLMYECGVAVNMDYNAGTSGANTYDARASLINFYHFSPNLSFAEKNHFSNSEWAYLVRKNIVNQQPVYYASQGAAHAFICDGFNQEGYYHFNFGWSGNADGWYVIEALDASGIGALDIKQSAVLDIRLDKESNVIIAQSMGQSVFCVDKPLKFCNLLGYNAYVGEENTEFYAQSKVIFKSKYSIRKLLVDIISFDYQEVILNDGADPSIEIDHLSSGSTNPNVSLSNSLECNYIGPGILYSGFELLISQDDDCRMVSNVTTDISSKSIKVSWSENGQASSWKVEYGKEGFSVGDGVSLITDTTMIVLPIENLDTIYEVRIQPICDTLYNNYVRSTVINRYWTDCVTSEPNGYYLDAEGDIHIYTAKGLAWLAKMAENDTDWSKYINYIEKDVFIENDIDLYGHLWSPIRYWLGNWDGNGFVISNMHAKRKSGGYATGFFNEFSGDTIANIGFINSYVDGRANESGTIAARIESCAVINSYSINCVIDGPSIYGGGLAGAASNSSFVNCFVIGNVHAGYGMGGLVGESRVCTLFNCYTSIKSSKYFNNLDFGTYRGLISASTSNSNVSNCFVDIDYIEDTWSAYSIENIVSENAADKVYFFGGLQEHLQDYKLKNIVGFTRNGNSFAHTVPDVALDYQYQGSIDLLTALNQYVEEMNSALLSKWVWDSVMKLPVLTKEYIEIACPSVTNVTASNISYNETYALKLTWHENGNADEWEIKCMPYGVTSEDSAKYYTSYDTTYIISNLILGKQYDISVTPICDTNEQKFWSTPFSHIFDKIYWVDVITTRPEGYVVGEDGNIQISSPEGLAWLSVCSNGLNGQAINYYNGITIEIVNNIDMGKYKWTPISHFLDFDSSDDAFAGYINGNNYTISNIYCHEIGNSHNLGLIGRASYAIFKNIKIKNAKIIGFYGIGTLISKANNCYINNCHAKDVFVHGTFHVGGLVGNMTSFDYGVTNNMDNIIVNSSSSGVVFGDQEIGGFIGMGTATIHNSFSTCDIYTINAMELDFRGGFIGEYAGKVENCYNAGLMKAHNLNYGENPSSGGSFGALGTSDVRYVYKSTKQPLCSKFVLGATVNISDTATFDKQGNFSQSIIIDSDSIVNLLDALNAWVDANNAEGQYLHWVADTAGVNGGFPIFAEEDTKYIITFCNDDGTILQQDTLEFGEMPEYRGGIPTKDSTEQYNYTFIGWDQEVVPVTKDVTYYAQYESTLNQYEITFYDWNGIVLQSELVNYGEMPTYTGVTPTREADAQYTYTFNGWSPQLDIVTGHQSYYAQYESTLNQYEINFYDWDGTLLQSSMVNYGEWPMYYNSDPWREADAQYTYTFIGWSPQLDWVSGNQAYYAQYEATLNQYEINFYNWDGTLLQSAWYNYGEYPSYNGETPTHEADAQYTYTFSGWSPQLDIVTGHQSYYAQYESTLNQYEINFYDWDGTLLQSEWLNYGEWPTYYNSDPWREADAQYTYTFLGWSPELDSVSGNQSYYAQYEATLNQYEINFYDWDGTLLQSGWYYYGDYPYYISANPERYTDVQYTYTFSGWSPQLDIVTGHQSYYAQYESTLNQYEINFYDWDGTLLQSSMVNYGEWPAYYNSDPWREADAQYTYTFTGWSPQLDWVSGNQAYYAQYEATLNQYEINFYNWDGTLLQSGWYYYGDYPYYISANPERYADAQYTYTFTGWSPQLDIVTGHQSYYAQYESTLNQYEINFYDWDGTLLQSSMVNYGEWPAYYNSDPWRDADAQYSYTFIGWSPQLDWVTGAANYYAQYESTLNQYKINFYDWDGTLLQSEWVNYGEMPTYTGVTPTREADAQYTYTFTGWSPQLDWVSGNQAYYAQYEATFNQYEINFYDWDGTLLQSSMVNYGEWPTYYNSDPWREADAQYTYTFLGWSPELDWVSGNQAYYAQYEATLNQYEITFYNWNGELLQSNMVNYGEWPNYYNSEPTREADAQYTYNFTGWSPELSVVTGNQSYTAQYEATLNQYEITFLNWDGEVLQSTMVDYGAMPEYFGVTPTKPEDDQYVYTFSGWEPEITIVVAYAEYTAQYDATDKVTTVIENTQSDEVKTYKILRNNKIFIIRGDKVYSILGHVIEDWMPLGL